MLKLQQLSRFTFFSLPCSVYVLKIFFLVLEEGEGQLADLVVGWRVDWVGIQLLILNSQCKKANCFHSATARCKSSLSSP